MRERFATVLSHEFFALLISLISVQALKFNRRKFSMHCLHLVLVKSNYLVNIFFVSIVSVISEVLPDAASFNSPPIVSVIPEVLPDAASFNSPSIVSVIPEVLEQQ